MGPDAVADSALDHLNAALLALADAPQAIESKTQVLNRVGRPLIARVERPPPQAMHHPEVAAAVHAHRGRPWIVECLTGG